jgi:hypothetical protein
MPQFKTRDMNMKRANYAEQVLRQAVANAQRGGYRPASSPIFTVTDIEIDAQSAYQVIDQGERGELIYIEVAANSTLIIPEIKLFDEKQQPITIINNRTFLDLLRLGRGITPGGVQATATGQTQDERATFIPNMFHLSRYKDDLLADWTGFEDRYIAARFVASIPFPYSTITFYIKNTTTDGPKRVHSVSVARTVYEEAGAKEIEQISAADLTSVEIEGDEVDVEEEQELPQAQYTNVNYNFPYGS